MKMTSFLWFEKMAVYIYIYDKMVNLGREDKVTE